VLVERILEVVFDLIEQMPAVSRRRDSAHTAEQWASTKRVAATVGGILFGIIISSALRIGFPGLSPDSGGSIVLAGATAGSLSPYAHQLLMMLWNTQKFLEEMRKSKANGG
jgi:hypothetical protein